MPFSSFSLLFYFWVADGCLEASSVLEEAFLAVLGLAVASTEAAVAALVEAFAADPVVATAVDSVDSEAIAGPVMATVD